MGHASRRGKEDCSTHIDREGGKEDKKSSLIKNKEYALIHKKRKNKIRKTLLVSAQVRFFIPHYGGRGGGANEGREHACVGKVVERGGGIPKSP